MALNFEKDDKQQFGDTEQKPDESSSSNSRIIITPKDNETIERPVNAPNLDYSKRKRKYKDCMTKNVKGDDVPPTASDKSTQEGRDKNRKEHYLAPQNSITKQSPKKKDYNLKLGSGDEITGDNGNKSLEDEKILSSKDLTSNSTQNKPLEHQESTQQYRNALADTSFDSEPEIEIFADDCWLSDLIDLSPDEKENRKPLSQPLPLSELEALTGRFEELLSGNENEKPILKDSQQAVFAEKSVNTTAKNNDINCPFCFESTVQRSAISTTCGHIFCASCFKNAVSILKICPICRKNLIENL